MFCVVVETELFHRHRQVKLYQVSYPLLLLLLPVLLPSTVQTRYVFPSWPLSSSTVQTRYVFPSWPLSPSTVQTRYVFPSWPLLVPLLRAALFNARLVGTPEKRCEISNYINDNAIDLMFLTETWLRSHGDEAKIADLAPSGCAVKSFLRPSRGGGIAVIFRTSLSSHLTVKADFSFTQNTFELVQTSVTLQPSVWHLFCVYRPPPNRKK